MLKKSNLSGGTEGSNREQIVINLKLALKVFLLYTVSLVKTPLSLFFPGILTK